MDAEAIARKAMKIAGYIYIIRIYTVYNILTNQNTYNY